MFFTLRHYKLSIIYNLFYSFSEAEINKTHAETISDLSSLTATTPSVTTLTTNIPTKTSKNSFKNNFAIDPSYQVSSSSSSGCACASASHPRFMSFMDPVESEKSHYAVTRLTRPPNTAPKDQNLRHFHRSLNYKKQNFNCLFGSCHVVV